MSVRPFEAKFDRTPAGVRFNVETVTANRGPIKGGYERSETGADFARTFYDKESTLKPRIEVSSVPTVVSKCLALALAALIGNDKKRLRNIC